MNAKKVTKALQEAAIVGATPVEHKAAAIAAAELLKEHLQALEVSR